MSDLNQQFEEAQTRVKTLSARPDNNTMLKLYALYKQGSVGDVQGDRPGLMDFVNRAKYDAWAEQQGTSQDEAKQKYVALVDDLKAKDSA